MLLTSLESTLHALSISAIKKNGGKIQKMSITAFLREGDDISWTVLFSFLSPRSMGGSVCISWLAYWSICYQLGSMQTVDLRLVEECCNQPLSV